MHNSGVVKQGAVAFFHFRHLLADVGELGHKELVDHDEFFGLGVGHLVMLIFGAAVSVSFSRAIVAIFEGRDPGGIRAEGKQHDICHQLPILRNVGGNSIGGSRTIGCGPGWLPTVCIAFFARSFDAPFDLVNAAEIFLEPLPI